MGKRTVNKRRSGVKLRQSFGRPARAARGSVGGVTKSEALSDASHAHSLVNPWAPDARGSKLPDVDASRSVAITTKFVANITGSAIGFKVGTSLSDPVRNGTSISATTINAPWVSVGTNPDSVAIQSAFNSYRIVSWGVRVIPLSAPVDQAGYIRVITLSKDPSGSVETTGSFFEEVADYPMADADIHWISKPKGNSYLEYGSITSGRTDWEDVVFFMGGLGPNGSIRVEVIYNLECQVALGSLTGALATPAADSHPRVLAAAANARAKSSNAHQNRPSFLSSIWSMAKDGLAQAASTLGPPVLRSVIPRLLRGTSAMPLLRDAPNRILEVD